MLEITIPTREYFDEAHGCFKSIKGQTIRIEHSLVSVSKWEAKWHKPFLANTERTMEEQIDYIRCMTITQNVDPNIYYFIPDKELDRITAYLEDPMTATWFSNRNGKPAGRGREVITSEIIYWEMIEFGIPFEFEKWHLNRLLTLIRVCSEKNSSGKKMSKKDIYAQNKALNAARRKKYNTKG